MFQVSNFTGNDDVRMLDSKGPFTTIEYIRDLSVTPQSAMMAYFCNEMDIRKRQVICDLSKATPTIHRVIYSSKRSRHPHRFKWFLSKRLPSGFEK